MATGSKTAVYSTMHPGLLPYMREWADSVCRQTDQDLDLWLGVDGVSREQLDAVLPSSLDARFLWSPKGCTPASVRSDAFSRLVDEYNCIILVDADDILDESRVAAAKSDLEDSDVAACALRLIDADSRDLMQSFCVLDAGSSGDLERLLPRWNVFGGSNSAYRASALRAGLPIPRACMAVDWFLATAAWSKGARFSLDSTPRMAYRQYASNIAKIIPPFSAGAVGVATALVAQHHELVLAQPGLLVGQRRAAVVDAQAETARFAELVLGKQAVLEEYVNALDELPPPQMWWTIVANPELEALWKE